MPTTLHLARYLAFSTTPFTDKETEFQREKGLAWSQPSLVQGQKPRGARELWQRREEDREEKEGVAWFPW